MNTNVFIATFTICRARLYLYDALELLGKCVLYYGIDCVVYVHCPDEPDVTTGPNLSSNELDRGQHFVEFWSSGPKNYGYLCNDGKSECKVKGHRVNVKGNHQINCEVLRQNTLDSSTLKPPHTGRAFIKHVRSSVGPSSTNFVPTLTTKTTASGSTNWFFDRVRPSPIRTATGCPMRTISTSDAHGLSSDLLDSDDDAIVQALMALDSETGHHLCFFCCRSAPSKCWSPPFFFLFQGTRAGYQELRCNIKELRRLAVSGRPLFP